MKKIISLFLCCVFLFICTYVQSSAQAEEKTVFYLNYGDITFDQYGAYGYDKDGNYISDNNSLGYIITQKNPNNTIDHGITVSSATCNIELLNLNVSRFGESNCAFALNGTADVTVTLSGVNHLVSGDQRAGLEVLSTTKATINGDGVLYAQSVMQAGIGGGNGKSNGTLVINSGTIYATGGIGGYATGIGGGSNGKGGNITINGGFVEAIGGESAAGIGGGFMKCGGNITINGGVVTAIGGESGAGIGSGWMASEATNVVINGGSVKAVAGANASNIGNGYKAKVAFAGIHNSAGNTVSLVNMAVSDFKQIFINGIDTSPITMLHPDDSKLYLYTDSTGEVITEYMNDGSVKFFKVNSSKTEQLYPYTDGCVRCEDMLITGDISSISVADGFTVNENKDLMYNSVRIDTFTPALRGDMNLDGILNGMDAVIVNCVVNTMLTDNLSVKLSDADGNGTVNGDDTDLLVKYGIGDN